MGSVFHFKQFDVVNDRSAMKVNTDGVLLGALVDVSSAGRVLDIGTGTGTIALMVAQRSAGAVIDAIDIDEASASEAISNFASCPWASRLHGYHSSLEDFDREGIYDLIVSNPPYFENSLTNPDERKTDARHTASLSYREIFLFAEKHLSKEGRVAFVLPSEAEDPLCRAGRSYGLFLQRIVRIRTTPKKQPKRIVVEFSRSRCAQAAESVLTIQDGGSYTGEYLELMHDFYLFA